ncbi:MAG: RrF2 family transcriptional regulator [Candidatus Xenobiia bacterium LiM19]
MKISTRGRYGLRIMIDLALHTGEGLVLLRDIAERQEISEKYIWQLIVPLKAAGLITSVRGAHGGYRLSKDPANITLRDIICTLEGPLSVVECVHYPEVCSRAVNCVSRDVWSEVSEKIQDILQSLTLADMVERSQGSRPQSRR